MIELKELDRAFKQLATALRELHQVINEVNQIFSFVDEFPACDGCGTPTLYKTLNSPITGTQIYICAKCWDEFMQG